MTGHTGQLTVQFDSASRETLYCGPSWYNKRVVDQLEIRDDAIVITFERAKRIDAEYLFTYSSPVRYQLYRAACWYLAVKGALPEVKHIALSQDGVEIPIDGTRLINAWEGCKVDVRMERSYADSIFQEHGKTVYIAMTYFLKAQLDLFSHDRYRAAWSGLNALYNYLSNESREKDKLNALARLIAGGKLPGCEAFVAGLDDDFWKRLDWYNFAQRTDTEDKAIKSDTYRDKTVFRNLLGAICDKHRSDAAKLAELEKIIARRMKKKQRDVRNQLCFLVVDYCYMLRNRSFHADKPYPVFQMSQETRTGSEDILTKLLLLAITDLLGDDEIRSRFA